MIDLRKIIPRDLRNRLMYALCFLPDPLYLKLFYFATTGRMLNLKDPRSYTEKLQWLKLHEKREEYHVLADKLAVRGHIREVLGEGYSFPLLGCWNAFDEIDFEQLPDQFVLKCNHDSGSTKIIRNKGALCAADLKALKRFYDKRMGRDYFYAGREYPYRGIERHILAEQLMEDEAHKGQSVTDYKFHCFNGTPKFLLVVSDRDTDCRNDFYDMEFQHLPITNDHANSNKKIPKPVCFEEMKRIAEMLSQGIKMVRIDLYEINGKIYFGEYTFFPTGGFRRFCPEAWEARIGQWIDVDGNG